MSSNMSKKNTVALKELRENMEEYITRVDKGESFTVFRRSKPIFRLAPLDDEEGWETVIDFTKVERGGVPATKVLRALEAIHGED